MRILPLKPQDAREISVFVQLEAADGREWVVFETDISMSGTWDVKCFDDRFEALQFEHDNSVIWERLDTAHVKEFIAILNRAVIEES